MDVALWVGPAIVAAAIAGLINVAGWFVTFRHARRLDRDRRVEKVIDIQTALLAEIRSDFQSLKDIKVEDEIVFIEQQLFAAPDNQPYTPFVPKDSGSPVFSAIVKDVAVLPNSVIDPVVLHYKQQEAIAHFTEDLRGDRFRDLPKDRKLAMMADYLRLKAHAGSLARDAIAALERSLGLPPSVSNTASALSDRQSASAG